MKKNNSSKILAKEIRHILDQKKADKITILDLQGISSLADFFVICSGTSNRHVDALADEVVFELKKKGEQVNHIEGQGTGTWVLLDYVDVIVHIFYHELRSFYCLEKLWHDAPRI